MSDYSYAIYCEGKTFFNGTAGGLDHWETRLSKSEATSRKIELENQDKYDRVVVYREVDDE